MIPASEANRKSLEVFNKGFYETLKDLESKIEKAISEGEFYINGVGILPDIIIQQLRELGYTVEAYSQYNEDGYTISWG